MESKMTAVEWLESKMPTAFKELTINKELIKQAKEMEKQQIIDAAIWMPKPFDKSMFLPELGKQYYNETYGKGSKK